MRVISEHSNSDNKISDVKVALANGVQKVKWNFKKADGFFVVCHKFDSDINLISYISEYMAGCSSEKGIHVVNDDLILISVPKSSYSQGGIELGKKNSFKNPMKVVILGYRVEDEMLVISDQSDEYNTDFIQITINYSQKFSRGFWIFKKAKHTLNIPSFDGFFEGLIFYTIEGGNAKFPVTNQMLNREFIVRAPRDGMVSLKVTDKYKKLYKFSSN